jgi:hypothetical protein
MIWEQAVASSNPAAPTNHSNDLAWFWAFIPTPLQLSRIIPFAAHQREASTATHSYFNVIASPLRSAFAISPTCLPLSSSTAPFWLVNTIARAPVPTASPAPAAP